jgi:hypothetical protein
LIHCYSDASKAVELIICYSREDAIGELVAAIGCQTVHSTNAGRFARNKIVQNVEAWQEGYKPIVLFIMERQWMLEASLCGPYYRRGGMGQSMVYSAV